jgi:hypothetical protein
VKQTQSNISIRNQKHYKKNHCNSAHKNAAWLWDGKCAPWIGKAVGSANNDGT